MVLGLARLAMRSRETLALRCCSNLLRATRNLLAPVPLHTASTVQVLPFSDPVARQCSSYRSDVHILTSALPPSAADCSRDRHSGERLLHLWRTLSAAYNQAYWYTLTVTERKLTVPTLPIVYSLTYECICVRPPVGSLMYMWAVGGAKLPM